MRILSVAVLTAGIVGTLGLGSALPAPTETLKPLLQQSLPNIPGNALTAVEVDFPPGARSVPHRHGSAFLFAYVLAGSIRSQIENEPVRTYNTGESWTEKPGDHHVLTENVSADQSATLLVIFVARQGESLKTDDPVVEP